MVLKTKHLSKKLGLFKKLSNPTGYKPVKNLYFNKILTEK